jgi:hypothetical protein
MSTSRWLTWTPKGVVMEEMSDPEPPKPSKVPSGGFEGPFSASSLIIERPRSASPKATSTCRDAATSQVFRWIGARCVIRRDTWSSEKSLWSDYVGWRQQHKVPVVPREQFAEILDQLFQREIDGWQGLALAIDMPASPYIV